MQVRKMLEGTQPIIMQTLTKSFKEGKTSHAYLISGQKGTPTKELAFFLAQSFVCDNKIDSLACEECLSCMRVADNAYTDFIYIDGSDHKISKEELEAIEGKLSRVSLETSGYKIYIIHLFENVASVQAANILLKFLEEPGENTVAIITTENQSSILPTIVSRCQLLKLREVDKKQLVSSLVNKGVNKEDAIILSERFNMEDDILQTYQDPIYLEAKDLAIDTLKELANNIKGINYFEMSEVLPFIEDKTKDGNKRLTLYLDLLGIILQDAIRYSLNQEVVFEAQKEDLAKLTNKAKPLSEVIELIMTSEDRIDMHVNSSLVMDKIFYNLRTKVGV